MKKVIFLTALLLSQNVESKEDFFVVNCGREDVMFSLSTFPFSLSEKEICDCNRKRWRGTACDVRLQNQIFAREVARKNSALANKILKGAKYELEL